jgi:formylglycine-generating enzyme required for sulfatase activity
LPGMEFSWIPSGSFDMGSREGNPDGRIDEEPLHTVAIDGFGMMTTEVTQAIWDEVMGGNEDMFALDPTTPAIGVSWDDCHDFIILLNAMDMEYVYRLPSEAEWEYACRAGTNTSFFWGDSMDGDYCWFLNNSDGGSHPVGTKLPNAWGLHDMSGNVWEWCEDSYHHDYTGAPDDGSAWIDTVGAAAIVTRGGSWVNGEQSCRSACRERGFASVSRHPTLGLRLVRTRE